MPQDDQTAGKLSQVKKSRRKARKSKTSTRKQEEQEKQQEADPNELPKGNTLKITTKLSSIQK